MMMVRSGKSAAMSSKPGMGRAYFSLNPMPPGLARSRGRKP